MNAVGLHDDVQTLLHEGGHAFHVFETSRLPYHQQLQLGTEFAEVASMGMELLAAPYLGKEKGGFYTRQQAARARIEFLEGSVLFWPYMAVVDAFQHWVYQHPQAARQPDNCDAAWSDLWDRLMVGVDWSGLEAEKVTGWHRKLHIFQIPFYYVEYGLALLGSMQVWRNAISDQAQAVARYRQALGLGGTVSLPELYATAGAKFAFDEQTLGQAVDLAMETIATLSRYGEEWLTWRAGISATGWTERLTCNGCARSRRSLADFWPCWLQRLLPGRFWKLAPAPVIPAFGWHWLAASAATAC